MEQQGPDPLEDIVGYNPNARFLKKRHLGQGSFGSTWKVEEQGTQTIYAAKIMNTNNMSTKDRGFVANEVKCLARCDHPNVVQHIISKEASGMLLIVMEYADGGDLYKQIKARQVGVKYFKDHEILFIFLQLCLALDHIHSKKMMHRDLKTANVLLTCTGLVKLGDFGFSRQYEDSLSNPVGSTFCGTPYYLSPELWRRSPYSKKSEMWALGVVLYEVMSLKRPFGGRNMDELIDNILHARYDPVPAHYPQELKDLVAQLLQVDPTKRPSLRQMFQQPYVRNNGLDTLRKCVETHTRIATEVRKQIVENIDDVLSGKMQDYDPPRVEPRKGKLHLQAEDSTWHDCELELMDRGIQVTDLKSKTMETVDMSTVTSICAVEPSISGDQFVFAIKSSTGKSNWYKETNAKDMQEWISALQNAMQL